MFWTIASGCGSKLVSTGEQENACDGPDRGRSHFPSCTSILRMLLPEHRAALEALIAKIYDTIPQTSEDVIQPSTDFATPMQCNNATSAESLGADILLCVRVQCAEQLRVYNRVVMATRYQLPVELWVAVFKHLSQRDRISVSHVCHDWRKTTLASGQLWNSPLFISSAHAEDCECLACKDGPTRPCRDCGLSRMHELKLNPVDQVETFLNRSGSFPVDLKMSVYPRAATSAMATLHEVVRPHVHRIESMIFDISTISTAQDFLESFAPFPALTLLELGVPSTSRTTWKLSQPLHLPTLRTLNFRGPLYCDQPFELHCPAVVSLAALFYHPLHILGLLKSCSAVQNILFKVGPRAIEQPSTEVRDEIHTLLKQANPRVVHISRLYKVDVVPVLALFGDIGIPHLQITCAPTECMERDHQSQFLFNEVPQPTRLECLRQEADEVGTCSTAVRLVVANATHRRTYVVRAGDFKEVEAVLDNFWGQLPRPYVGVQLYVSSSLWPALFRCEVSGPSRIVRAYIRIDGGDNLREWLEERVRKVETSGLSELEALRFTAKPSHDAVQIDEQLVQMVENAFKLKSKLKMLELKGFTVEGDLAVLDSIADEFRVL